MGLLATGLTDTGLVRKHNEDNIYVDASLGLFVVADGLGGHAAGEVASKIVIDEMAKFIELTSKPNGKAPEGIEFDNRQSVNYNRLKASVLIADKTIAEDIIARPERETMGSTVVACLVEGSRVTLGHVGDSRAYRVCANGITQLTKDHSWVADQVASGFLTLDEAKKHPFRNIITQALGNGGGLVVDIQEFDLAENETVLLCSDGLTGMVADSQILETCNQALNLHDAASGLVRMAIENGGEDNISVVLVKLSPA